MVEITNEYLTELRMAIENMNKTQQLNILRILKQYPTVKLNENRGGIFLNMSFLPEGALVKMQNYVNYIKDQEQLLFVAESKKDELKKTFFSGGIAIGEIN